MIFLLKEEYFNDHTEFKRFQDIPNRYKVNINTGYQMVFKKVLNFVTICSISLFFLIMPVIMWSYGVWIARTYENSMILYTLFFGSMALMPILYVIGLIKFDDCVIISHRWLSQDNPDPDQAQFNDISKINCKYIFYDYSCLPQYPRTEEEECHFRNDLSKIDELYRYYPVHKIIYDDYYKRGWCVFESACSESVIWGLFWLLLMHNMCRTPGWNIVIKYRFKEVITLTLIMLPIIIVANVFVLASDIILCENSWFKLRQNYIDEHKLIFTNGSDRSLVLGKL